eukprot:COSAG02_NODE_48097_length_336_cov_0.856540_1_plen_58_part_10
MLLMVAMNSMPPQQRLTHVSRQRFTPSSGAFFWVTQSRLSTQSPNATTSLIAQLYAEC